MLPGAWRRRLNAPGVLCLPFETFTFLKGALQYGLLSCPHLAARNRLSNRQKALACGVQHSGWSAETQVGRWLWQAGVVPHQPGECGGRGACAAMALILPSSGRGWRHEAWAVHCIGVCTVQQRCRWQEAQACGPMCHEGATGMWRGVQAQVRNSVHMPQRLNCPATHTRAHLTQPLLAAVWRSGIMSCHDGWQAAMACYTCRSDRPLPWPSSACMCIGGGGARTPGGKRSQAGCPAPRGAYCTAAPMCCAAVSQQPKAEGSTPHTV